MKDYAHVSPKQAQESILESIAAGIAAIACIVLVALIALYFTV